MTSTLPRPLSGAEARIHELSRDELIKCALVLAWYGSASNTENEEDGYRPIEGSSSICRDNGSRAREVLREVGVKR